MNPGHGYGYGAPPPRKGTSTAVIVLLVIVGLVAVGVLTGVVLVVRFTREVMSSPIGEETSRAFDSPGAKELRTFGCNPVSIIDVASMPETTELYRKDPRRAEQPVDVPLIIDCGPGLGKARTCGEVKDEYTRVARPKTPFRVFVHGYDAKPLCNEHFAP